MRGGVGEMRFASREWIEAVAAALNAQPDLARVTMYFAPVLAAASSVLACNAGNCSGHLLYGGLVH